MLCSSPGIFILTKHPAKRSGLAALILGLGIVVPAHADCTDPSGGLGVARTVEIDAASGAIFGSFTKQAHERSFLIPNEVVLTFDDGPMPWITKSILDTLDQFCTKATFFSVGKMALAYPASVRDVLARGHTLGTHTYTHPFNLPHMKPAAAQDEIERGFAAVATAAGQPIAPFFRFTGLSDSAALLAYLQPRHIASFTVDVVSNDSFISDKQRLIDHTLKDIEAAKGGIILFHDIKATTAKALPEILAALKTRGYSVVHMRPKDGAVPLAPLMAEMAPKLAKADVPGAPKTLVPFYGATGPEKPPATGTLTGTLAVTSIVPEPKDRSAVKAGSKTSVTTDGKKPPFATAHTKARSADKSAASTTRTAGWLGHVEFDAEPEIETLNPPVFVTEEPEPEPSVSPWATEIRPGGTPRIKPTLKRSMD